MSHPLDAEWCERHFDFADDELNRRFNETLEYMRQECPIAHSDQQGGFWVTTRYDDVLATLQSWRNFSNADRVRIPPPLSIPPMPMSETDPPLHGAFRRVVNPLLTPRTVAEFEEETRRLVSELIDDFIEIGSCEFMSAFAEQLPRQSFFELVLHASTTDIAFLNDLTRARTGPTNSSFEEAQERLTEWIDEFVTQRQNEPPKGDIVDAIIRADLDGRPISRQEAVLLIELIMLGGFETTASALGHAIIRMARDPSIPTLLRGRPELIPGAVEEFLRLDPPVASFGRTATRDGVLPGHRGRAGDKVLIHVASANRDEKEFLHPHDFDPYRMVNRHLTFGAGPHRCVGSNVARLNLRVAIEEITARMDGLRLEEGREPIEYRLVHNRTPIAVPLTFTSGSRAVTRG